MNWRLLIVFAIVATAVIAFSISSKLLYGREPRAFLDDVYLLKKSVEEGEVLLNFRVGIEERETQLVINTPDGAVNINASTVKIVFKVPSAPPINNTNDLWNIWSNGTFAGVASWIKVVDSGTMVTVLYVDAENLGETYRIKVFEEVTLLKLYVENGIISFDNEQIYSFQGYRKLIVKKLVLKT